MTPRPDVSEERRNQILDAATEVFTQKGFQKARMDDIVERAKLSKGTLYWYFKSKDEIILGIFDRIFGDDLPVLKLLAEENQPAMERLHAYLNQNIRSLKWMLGFAPLSLEFLSLAFRHKYFREAFQRYLERHLELLVSIIQQGIDSGEFRAADAEEVAITLSAIFEGTILLWVYDSTRIDPEAHIRSGVDMLLEGIRA